MKKLKIKDAEGKTSGYGFVDLRYQPTQDIITKSIVQKTSTSQVNIFDHKNDDDTGV